MQILSWMCLIMCAQAIAFIPCQGQGELATAVNVKTSDRDDQQQSIEIKAVVHGKRGAYGGSDLVKKPSNTKNGASHLPVNIFGGVTFPVIILLVLQVSVSII